MEIHCRVKALRKALKLSQGKFGAALGVSRDVINNVENARVELSDLLCKAMCAEYNTSEEWLKTGGGEMFVISESDAKAAVMQQLSDVYQLDDIDKRWLDIVLSLPPGERGQLKALALRLAEAAANLSDDMEAGEEIVADAQAAHDAAFAEWNKGLTEEEEVALVRKRHADAKRGAGASTTYANHGRDATLKSSAN